jgi:diguanylate cyclase (GGDEF)-like protein
MAVSVLVYRRERGIMDSSSSGQSDYSTDARSTAKRAREADRSASNADQTASDADQTSSDADQTASERDDFDAARDQVASDQDQASADRHRRPGVDAAAEDAYEAARSAREASTVRRLASHVDRANTARLRALTATERDRMAARRDEIARQRDAQTEAIDQAISASDAPLDEKFERLRARAAADRRKAAEDRSEAARERAELEAELSRAHLDDLTGAYRRESGTLALKHEIERARRGDGRFVIAFVDIDGMKEVNDRDGHAAGDHVLQTLVWHMRSKLRSFDPVVRYGGDEFVAGLAGIPIGEAGRRFEVIDQSVRREVGVGISVGLAELEPDETLDQLTARADAALLDAKASRPG